MPKAPFDDFDASWIGIGRPPSTDPTTDAWRESFRPFATPENLFYPDDLESQNKAVWADAATAFALSIGHKDAMTRVYGFRIFSGNDLRAPHEIFSTTTAMTDAPSSQIRYGGSALSRVHRLVWIFLVVLGILAGFWLGLSDGKAGVNLTGSIMAVAGTIGLSLTWFRAGAAQR